MSSKAGDLFLTESQAACLIALRDGRGVSELAIRAMLPLSKAETGLAALSEMGLAVRDQTNRWQVTARGRAFQFATVPDRIRRDSSVPGPNDQNLIDLLERPMAVAEIAQRSGLSHQGVRQLVIKLHAQGLVKFADPENPFWLIMRTGDQTRLLSRAEERVLSAVPADYATSATKIRVRVKMPADTVQPILETLMALGLVEAFEGWQGSRLYRIAGAGLTHPQRKPSARQANAPHLGLHSDRVREVLSAIADGGALRIKQVAEAVSVPHQSINALMQYLKRKQLVKKNGDEPRAPYRLTENGHAALVEMARRRAA